MVDSLRIEGRKRSEQCHSARVTLWRGASADADAALDVKRGTFETPRTSSRQATIETVLRHLCSWNGFAKP